MRGTIITAFGAEQTLLVTATSKILPAKVFLGGLFYFR